MVRIRSEGPSRRDVVAGVTAVGVANALAGPALGARRANYPPGFLWGTAISAHQSEGNNTNSDAWLMENLKPSIFKDRSGDACDSYHRYAEDIDIAASLGFNCYRFGIEWARIEPAEGMFSKPRSTITPGCSRRASARAEADGDLQPLHRAALVRDARRVRGGGWCRPVRALLRQATEHLGDAHGQRDHLQRGQYPGAA